MSETLGRDRLGRLIYSHDRILFKGVVFKVLGVPYGLEGIVVLEVVSGASPIGARVVWLSKCMSQCEVDLTLSPDTDNYLRYFADLGLREEIDSACTHICETLPSEECLAGSCVFDRWCDDCTSFRDWLQEEATE